MKDTLQSQCVSNIKINEKHCAYDTNTHISHFSIKNKSSHNLQYMVDEMKEELRQAMKEIKEKIRQEIK